MKIVMTSLESNEVVMEIFGKSITDCLKEVIVQFSKQFGEEYLHEVVIGLAELTGGETEYIHTDFSDPESNFKLNLYES